MQSGGRCVGREAIGGRGRPCGERRGRGEGGERVLRMERGETEKGEEGEEKKKGGGGA